MVTRREILGGAAGLAIAPLLPAPAWADEAEPIPPLELGRADFSGAWSLETPGIRLVAAAPDLDVNLTKAFTKVSLSSASDIDDLFTKPGGGTGFIDWFNGKVAGQPYWEHKSIRGTQEQFTAFWDQYLAQKSLNLLQFIAYMSVFTNEVDGRLVSVTEAYGYKGHPGISYLFDTVTLTTAGGKRTWTKRSYNAGKANRSAGSLFNDPRFQEVHANEPLAKQLQGSSDEAWLGDVYPDGFPTVGDPKVNGYILSADFFKFRGRGLIQTTWRDNYRQIVEWMVANPTASGVVTEYASQWQNRSTEDILTATTSQDWDRIFGDGDKAVLCAAIRLHDAPLPDGIPRYSNLSSGPAINGKTKGSLVRMGKMIGGSEGYGNLLKGRVRQICSTLGSV